MWELSKNKIIYIVGMYLLLYRYIVYKTSVIVKKNLNKLPQIKSQIDDKIKITLTHSLTKWKVLYKFMSIVNIIIINMWFEWSFLLLIL